MTYDRTLSQADLERARDEPADVAVADVVPCLESEDGSIRKAAADVLYEITKHEPARLIDTGAVPALVATLHDSDPLVREGVALALANVAEESDVLVSHTNALAAHLGDDYDIVTDTLAYALRRTAETTPEALVDSVPELAEHLDAELDSTRFHVLSALVGVARERPARLHPVIEPVFDVIDGRDSRIEALDGPESADEPRDIEGWVVETALTVVATMAAERPADTATRLRTYVPRLSVLLNDPHAGIRSVTAGTLAAIAEYEPDAVEPATDALADRLEDHATVAAGNAVWALRYLDTQRSRAVLREADPDDADIRAVIDAALAELDG